MLRQYTIQIYSTFKNQFPKMSFAQFDSKSSRISFEMYNDIDNPMTDIIEAVATVQRNDGTEKTYGMTLYSESEGKDIPVFEISGNIVTFILPVSALYVKGKTYCQVHLYDSNYGRITIPTFTYDVVEQLVDDIPQDTVDSYPVLSNILNAENTRITNEEERISAEEERANSEVLRINAETSRVNAESARAAEYKQIKDIIMDENNAANLQNQINTIDSSLNDIAKQFKASNNPTKQMFVTLMDDDGRSEFITLLKPVLDEYGIKMSLAINTGLIGRAGYMTWTQIEQLKAEGHEILNHTIGNGGTEIANKSLEQLKADYESEKTAFIAHGLDTYDYMVYSGMMPWQDVVTRNKISEVYKCCFANTDAPVNYLPFDNYAIHRGSLTYLPIPTIDKYIDMGKGYLVLFQHSYNYGAPEIATLRTVLDYLIQKGFIFVTAKEMVDNFSNIINLGNAGQDKFLLDKNGNVNFSVGGANINDLLTVYYRTNNFSNADISTYKKNSVTYEKVGGSYANYWLPEAGICKTYRFDDDRYAYREYTKIGTNEIWKATYNDTLKKWIPFSPLSVVSATTTTLPKFIRKGQMLFVSNKPRWAQADGYGLAYTSVLRSTAYALGDNVNVGSGNPLYECVVAGMTSDVAPTYGTTLNGITVDGTAEFKYFGDKAVYRDATGTVVSP